MVKRFFLFPSPKTRQHDSYQDQSHRMLLLSGPPSSGKTSLLFQFAYNSLMESDSTNAKVVFICNRRRLENNPPYLSQGIDPSSDLFQRIEIKYVEGDEGIKKYFAAFHLHDTFPLSVVVDDFGAFFGESNRGEKYNNPRGRDLAMVRVLALCQSAISHANKIRPCTLLLSDTCHGDSPRLLFIYKRWISSIFIIKGDGSGSFILHKYIHSISSQSMRIPTARFSIALQYLILESFCEEREAEQLQDLKNCEPLELELLRRMGVNKANDPSNVRVDNWLIVHDPIVNVFVEGVAYSDGGQSIFKERRYGGEVIKKSIVKVVMGCIGGDP